MWWPAFTSARPMNWVMSTLPWPPTPVTMTFSGSFASMSGCLPDDRRGRADVGADAAAATDHLVDPRHPAGAVPGQAGALEHARAETVATAALAQAPLAVHAHPVGRLLLPGPTHLTT